MRSRLLTKVLLLILSCVCLLTAGGVYATWSYAKNSADQDYRNMGLGFAQFDYPPIHITAVVKKSGDGSVVVNDYYDTHLDSSVTLVQNASSTVTLTITVHNQSDKIYAFNAVKYLAEAYSNENIVHNLPVLKHGDEIAPEEYLTFDVTFSFKAGASRVNTVLDSVINFEFVLLDDLPEEEEIAVSGALEQFQNIINNIVRNGSFEDLIAQMDDYDNNDRYNGSYIGNVTGASPDDAALLKDLFQGNLHLNIDGVDTEVTILIKRENVDGNVNTGDENGNEMSIYLTTDSLSRPFRRAPVYAAVFTSETDGDSWYQLGNMYKGRAVVKGYDGNPIGSGSFDTDDWETYGDSTMSNGKTIEEVIATIV